MKKKYQEPILEVIEVTVESGFAASDYATDTWVDGGPGGDFDVNDYGYEL